jgi:hypothetical protein
MSDNAADEALACIGMCLQRKAGNAMPISKHAGILLAAMIMAPLSAHASITHDVVNFLGMAPDSAPVAQPAAPAIAPITVTAPGSLSKPVELTDFDMPTLPTVAVSELPQPSVETPLHKLFCVEYARTISGLNIFGDAKFWWTRAKTLYARMAVPAEHAVMVFAGSTRLKKGHVAVVTDIVSKREIRVDQANWQNHGEIDHATPVLDVSTRNDWTQVRVWDMRSNGFGAHVYAVSGFIAKSLIKQARRE